MPFAVQCGMSIHHAIRRIAAVVLRVFPTCDLQFALSTRLGVSAIQLGLGEMAALQIGNQQAQQISGPCTLTVNHD